MALRRLAGDLADALGATRELSAATASPTYLVGGAVRDSLLGRPIADIDLAVEGDAVALALALAERLDADVRIHDAFRTATVTLPSGRRLDLATVRRETYARPTALPVVETGSVKEDLHRRDFTVNSLALPIGDLDHAAVIAPSGGLSDLEGRTLRVHHDDSFRDDPTRILRGARFEARLGFRFDPHTEELARTACADGLLRELSGGRLRAEIDLLFAEPAIVAIVWRRLRDLGALASIGFAGDAGDLLHSVVEVDLPPLYPSGVEPARLEEVLLLAALAPESSEARSAIGERLGLGRGLVESLAAVDSALDELGAAELERSRLAEALARLSPAGLALVQAAGDGALRERVRAFLAQEEDLRLGIDGEMLLQRGFAPGPEIGRALRETRKARLDGRIERAEELDFAVDLLKNRNGA